MKIVISLFIISHVTFTLASAQTVMTLNESIDYASKHSSLIRMDSLVLKRNEYLLKNQTNNLIPSLTFSSNLGGLSGRSIDPSTNTFTTRQTFYQTLGFQSNVVLFSSSSYKLLKEAAKNSFTASEFKLSNDRLSLTANVLIGFMTVMNANAKLEATKKSIGFYDRQIKIIDTLILYGRKGSLDKLSFEQQRGADSIMLIQQKAQLQESILQLRSLINIDAPVGFQLEEQVFTDDDQMSKFVHSLSASELENLFLKGHPLLGQNQSELRLREIQLQIAKRSWVPTIGIGLGIGSNYSNNFFSYGERTPYLRQLFQNNLSQSAFLNISFPILNHQSTKKAIFQAAMTVEEQALNNQTNLSALKKAISSVLNETISSYETYLQSKVSLARAERLLAAHSELYRSNRLTSADFLSTWRDYSARLLTHADLKTSAILRILTLRLYANKKFMYQND